MAIATMYKVVLAILLFELPNFANSIKNDLDPSEVLKSSKIKPLTLPRKNIRQLDILVGSPFDAEISENQYKKKSPKSTIQKIIKKHQMKSKKYYIKQISKTTIKPTVIPMKKEKDLPQRYNPTTLPTFRKKTRKVYNKIVRNPQPFNRLHYQKRNKRKISDNLYILQDLDEVKFVGNDSDYDTIITHVKNY